MQNFAGKKSKLAEKLADFVGFSREKVKIRGKIRRFRGRKVKIRRKIDRFRGILAEKVKFRRIFRGKFIEKSADFTGKLRQETISKNQPISLGFFWQSLLKTINFASIWPALFNVFLTGIIICSFNNSLLEKWANAKVVYIVVSAQFFATFI